MSNILLLPQFDGTITTFSLTTNGNWTDIIYFFQPGFGSPVQVSGCGITSGSNAISVPNTSMLFPGMTISSLAAGIPPGAFTGVISIPSLTMVDNNGGVLNATQSNADMTLLFNPPPLDLTGIKFICNLRSAPGNAQVFLTAQTADATMLAGGVLGTLQWNVPYTTIMAQVPPGSYVMDLVATDGGNFINLFPNAPAVVTVRAGITDPSLLLT